MNSDDQVSPTAPRVPALLAHLVDHRPRDLRRPPDGRNGPDLALPRLYLHGEPVEPHSAEYRLTLEEAVQALQARGCTLSAPAVVALLARIDGLGADLSRPGGLSQQRALIPEYADGRSCARPAQPFCVDQVLQAQPAYLQRFLLATAILSHLRPRLCDELFALPCPNQRLSVSGLPAAAVLEDLAQTSLFLTPADHLRDGYRYHPLLRAALRQRLSQSYPEWERQLYQRACAWYAAEGLLAEPLTQALSVGDRDRAIQLLERCDAPAPASHAPALVEPLRERELQILAMLAEGVSTSAIAERLYIGVGTVRWHIKNLLGKLTAHSRLQAVARARTLGLIP